MQLGYLDGKRSTSRPTSKLARPRSEQGWWADLSVTGQLSWPPSVLPGRAWEAIPVARLVRGLPYRAPSTIRRAAPPRLGRKGACHEKPEHPRGLPGTGQRLCRRPRCRTGCQANRRLHSVTEPVRLSADSVERVVERAPAHYQCNLCFPGIFAGHRCRQCARGGAAVLF